MSFGIGLIIVSFVLYVLLVKGVLWKLLVAIFAFLGMHTFLTSNFHNSTHTFVTVGDTTFSWATTISIFIILMASLYTRE